MTMTLAGKRVLVIEDEAIISMMIEQQLTDMGCEVVETASRLRGALEKARVAEVDLAVLDLNLHGEMSYPVAEVLRARGVPFLFVTGYGGAGLPDDLRNARV